MQVNEARLDQRHQNVLVTGAAGFIGSHLVSELLRRGYRVTSLVRPGEDMSRIRGLDCRVCFGDLLERSSLVEATAGADYVFHLAALMGGASPEALFRVNVEGTRNLIDVCRERAVVPERFLFASSVTAMGPSGEKGSLNEDAPCRPVSGYGRSKLAAEEYLASMNSSLPYTILRLPVVYGPGSDGGLYIFFKLISKGLRVNFGALEATVCFVWDVVRGMVDAAENPGTSGETYILGEEKAYPLDQVYRTIASILGKRPVTLPLPYFLLHFISFFIETLSKLKGGVPALTREELSLYVKHRYWRYETVKASRDFGFQSCYPFDQGARITVDWYRQQGYL